MTVKVPLQAQLIQFPGRRKGKAKIKQDKSYDLDG